MTGKDSDCTIDMIHKEFKNINENQTNKHICKHTSKHTCKHTSKQTHIHAYIDTHTSEGRLKSTSQVRQKE